MTSDVRNAFVQRCSSSQDVQVRLGCARLGPGPGTEEPPFSFYLILNFLLGLYSHQGAWILGIGKFKPRRETKGDPRCLRGLSTPYSRANLLLTGGLQARPSQVFQRQQARCVQKKGNHIVLSSPQQRPVFGLEHKTQAYLCSTRVHL